MYMFWPKMSFCYLDSSNMTLRAILHKGKARCLFLSKFYKTQHDDDDYDGETRRRLPTVALSLCHRQQSSSSLDSRLTSAAAIVPVLWCRARAVVTRIATNPLLLDLVPLHLLLQQLFLSPPLFVALLRAQPNRHLADRLLSPLILCRIELKYSAKLAH